MHKLALDKKYIQKPLTKPKSAVPSTNMCVFITMYHYGTQYSTEQF